MSAVMSQCVGRISCLRIHQSRPEHTPVGQGAKQVAEVAVAVAVAEQTELKDFHWPKIMAKQSESLDAKIKEAVARVLEKQLPEIVKKVQRVETWEIPGMSGSSGGGKQGIVHSVLSLRDD